MLYKICTNEEFLVWVVHYLILFIIKANLIHIDVGKSVKKASFHRVVFSNINNPSAGAFECNNFCPYANVARTPSIILI